MGFNSAFKGLTTVQHGVLRFRSKTFNLATAIKQSTSVPGSWHYITECVPKFLCPRIRSHGNIRGRSWFVGGLVESMDCQCHEQCFIFFFLQEIIGMTWSSFVSLCL